MHIQVYGGFKATLLGADFALTRAIPQAGPHNAPQAASPPRTQHTPLSSGGRQTTEEGNRAGQEGCGEGERGGRRRRRLWPGGEIGEGPCYL